MSESGVGRPYPMSLSGREAPKFVRVWSRGPPRMSRSGQEALTDVRDRSEGPFGCPRVVGSP